MVNRHRHGTRILAYFIIELGVLSGAFFTAYAIRAKSAGFWGMELDSLNRYLWLWPLTLVLWSALLWSFNTYAAFRSRGALMHGFLLGLVSLLGVLGTFAVLAIVKEHTTNRSLVGLVGVVGFISLFVFRILALAFLSHYTQKGYDRHYVLIGGAHEDGLILAQALEAIRGAVYEVHGFVSQDPAEVGRTLGRWTVLGTFDKIPALAEEKPTDVVYLLPVSGALEEHRALVEQCEAMGMEVRLRLSPFERMLSRLDVHDMGGVPFLSFSTAPRSATGLLVKRLIDLTGALAMLILLSPLLLMTALLVRLASRGPAIFRQERAGMNGRVFTLYKFRTMVQGAEKQRAGLEEKNEMSGPVFKIRDDPRVNLMGSLLRRTSIDELPQLWNVLKGDMSLVGPRPLPVYEVEKFERWQRRRMSMRPGVTCLWQVSGRNRVTDFSDWIRLDLEYVDRWSLGLDMKILLKTVPAVLGGRGAY